MLELFVLLVYRVQKKIMLINKFIQYIDFRLLILKTRKAFFKQYKRKPKSKLRKEIKKEFKKAIYGRHKKNTI